MKRLPLVLLLLLASGAGLAAEKVRATYRTMDGRNVQAEWGITRKGDVVRFQLNGQDRATAYLKNGRVMKLILRKRHAGKWKDMVISRRSMIEVELNSAFYPFAMIRAGDSRLTEWQSGTTHFKHMLDERAE